MHGGDARTGRQASMDRRDIRWDPHQILGSRDEILGKGTVPRHTQHFEMTVIRILEKVRDDTLADFPAGHAASQCFDDARWFVPGDVGQRRLVGGSFAHMQIGSAYSARNRPNEDFSRTGHRALKR
jgi:hypothetical protein